jgi:hypothetical protein
MVTRYYRWRWGWLVLGTVALALAGAWVSADAKVPAWHELSSGHG